MGRERGAGGKWFLAPIRPSFVYLKAEEARHVDALNHVRATMKNLE